MALGKYSGNVAHSNVRFGLRIFTLYSREKPCDPYRTADSTDPWKENPSI